ncbi:hypothetical protein Purlil1_12435 [Purpureocillium lilacinum]|uniref:C3H1-type domain-containing protein n=1 Tax=Purpureocillium lilacinum TaxID=33203 RepID=A0ABR0BGV7_PURLI|nr:hypothetical protein Purlil1_12435 [Purpureocillium lilacinum]
MTDLQTALEDLKAKWDVCQREDDRKLSLIRDLFGHADLLSKQLSELEAEFCDKKDAIKLARAQVSDFKKEVEERKKQIEDLRLEKARQAFAVVLIDGDCMPFKDELVRRGLNGGKDTASMLVHAVKEGAKSQFPATAPYLQVIVRVYANAKGLASAYDKANLPDESLSLNNFIRGFNMGNALCDYVDAGDGKECSDEKLKGKRLHAMSHLKNLNSDPQNQAIFQLHIGDVHCQQVLLGASADNGYARLLEPYLSNEAASAKIYLLDGPPFAREMAEIRDRLRTFAVDVFRSQRLPNMKRKVSFRATTPTSATTSNNAITINSPVEVMGYASVAAQPAAQHVVLSTSTATNGHTNKTVTIPVSTVLRNKLWQRVDAPIEYSRQDYYMLIQRKLCNHFHLLGACEYQAKYGECQHQHGAKLPPKQLSALRAVARLSPCPSQLNCNDPDCIFGHRCTRDNCVRQTCRFTEEMHHVDTQIHT